MSKDYKKLFGQKDVILTSKNRETLGAEIESVEYMTEYFNKKERFIPPVDLSQPKYFARFGSAEKYYIDAIDRIYKTYPYDGSLKERIQWELSSSLLDLHIFENGYPRTNGHIILSVNGWGTQEAASDGYGAPPTASYEYIFIKGGPNTSIRTKGKDIRDTSGDYRSGYSNIWEPSKNRESNLKIGGIDGNTVEFWLKKDAFLGSSLTNQEVLFDLYTSDFASSSANYGRLTIELSAAVSGSPFKATYMSGTSGFSSEIIGSDITTSSVADNSWHHYAFTFENTGSNVEVNLYIDGTCNETVVTGSSINYVSGNINGTIGALAISPSGTSAPTLGWGKLSGSLDEFRFWKTKRTTQQIARYYIEPVGGGTNTDDANTTLGVYYKFNEGISQTSSVDSTILDYSGRISNGSFVGYISSSRSTDSALVISGKVTKEFKDPILYSFHPSVSAFRETKKSEGQLYDDSNNASIYHTLPNWILAEDEYKEYTPLRNLTQIIGSYFDSLANQIWAIPKLKHKNYLSSSFKAYPFSDRLLESVGFSYFPELFSDATALAQFKNREDKSLFTQKLYDVKNRIYQNIYNNIVYIYKTKGTEKSFRNLIRCFGFDDEIYKINLYGNRVTYQFKDNYSSVAEFKKYINFALTGTHRATVFPVSSSGNSNSTSFISGTNPESTYTAFTMETEVAFPRRHSLADTNTVVHGGKGSSKSFRSYEAFRTASLFGVHQVRDSAPENNLTWNSNDYANFQVCAIKDGDHSKRCYFRLTGVGSTVMPTLTSSYFDEVFDDTRWTFAISVRPSIYPTADLPSGSSTEIASSGYKVEFYGVEKVLDTVKNEFLLTSSIVYNSGSKFLQNKKSVYIGAHRENFSGSLQEPSDGGVSSTRVWLTYLTTGTIQQHAQDAKNYGVPNPYKSAYLYQTSMAGTRVPEIHTLVLNWTFDSLTGSDSNGEFIGDDFSSGSTSLQNRYNWIGDIVGKQYLPKGYGFPSSFSGSINKKYVYSAKKQLPEFINSSNMVNILSEDDMFFNKVDLARPTNYYMYIEKSMYQTISEEMIRMFSSIKDFNNLIGEPVNKYREKYKHMEKLRQLFFERVGNTPDLDKYIDFYKWIDQTLDVLLGYLVPASADISDQYGSNIRTLVESHVLERNKYKWQFPTIEDKLPPALEATTLGINELLYNWEFGHATGSNFQSDKCLWWKERAERTDALASGDTSVDSNKQTILDSINNDTNANNYILYDSASSTTYSGSTFAIRRLAKPYRFRVDESPVVHGGPSYYKNKKKDFYKGLQGFGKSSTNVLRVLTRLVASKNDLDYFKDCDDDYQVRSGQNKKVNFKATACVVTCDEPYKGDLVYPFNIYSSSISHGYLADLTHYGSQGFYWDLTNIHTDTCAPYYEIPMQSPFTEKHVGGNQHRHININTSSQDNRNNRPEAFLISHEGYYLSVVDPSSDLNNPTSGIGTFNSKLPTARYYRDETAKRPVNIRNIQQATGSRILGNYRKDYEVLMTNGRSINNRYFVKNEGITASSINSAVISGALDYNLPGTTQSQRDRQEVVINGLTSSARNDYIIVNRFSAPGDPSTMGFAFLDIESQEYSVYNSLPWRNIIVRESLQELLTNHTKQFGYFSDAQNSASYVLAGVTYPGTTGSVNTGSYYATEGYTDATASFHKVNRNPRKVIKFAAASTSSFVTGTVYDNWHVQHQIPQSDLQYAWITASIVENYTGSALYGFEKPDFSNASLASTDITFCSASDYGSYHYIGTCQRYYGANESLLAVEGGTDLIRDNFVGIGPNFIDPVSSSENTLGFPLGTFPGPGGAGSTLNIEKNYLNFAFREGLDHGICAPAVTIFRVDTGNTGGDGNAVAFNGLMLRRNGPYGWPSWKQVRGENHSVVRTHRKENRQSFLKLEEVGTVSEGAKFKKTIVSQIEPPITSKFKPFKHRLRIKENNKKNSPTTEITMRHTYGNEQNWFPQKVSGSIDLNKADFIYTHAGELGQSLLQGQKSLIYDSINKFILNRDMSGSVANPVDGFIDMTIGQTIYPREHYTYLKSTRQRDNFRNGFWRDARASRRRLNTDGNSQTYTTGCIPDPIFDDCGTTSNPPAIPPHPWQTPERYDSIWSLDARSNFDTGSLANDSGALGTLYGFRDIWNDFGELQNFYSVFAIRQSGSYGYGCLYNYGPTPAATYNRPVEEFYGLNALHTWSCGSPGVIYGGETKWEAGDQAGINPFYDTYGAYIEDMKRVGKNYGIIPEFRISEHMDYYVNQKKEDFLAENPSLFTLTGSTLSSSNEESFYTVYSTSDFMQYVDMVREDYGKVARPTELTLECKGLMKFLPYDGFYPAQRTLQIASLFSKSFGPNVSRDGDKADRPRWWPRMWNDLIKPIFSPGVLYNSIKSGIAVDYPIPTGALPTSGYGISGQVSTNMFITGAIQLTRVNPPSTVNGYASSTQDIGGPRLSGTFDYRVPFEVLADPDFYLNGLKVGFCEPYPISQYTTMSASYGASTNPLFRYAMNNFLAETPSFFLQDGQLSTISTDSDDKKITVEENKLYKMRIVCSHSEYQSLNQLEGTSSQVGQFRVADSASFVYNPPTITMYNRAFNRSTKQDYSASFVGVSGAAQAYGSSFGPPCDAFSSKGKEASFEPFTPPYYNGYSHIEVAYTSDVGGETPITEILSKVQSTATSYRECTRLGYTGSTVGHNAMSLSASLNWNQLVTDPETLATRWVIQPKWECPILDFNSADITLPITGSGSVAKGMWHQYGSIPSASSGIILSVQDVPGQPSLKDLLNITNTRVKLGRVSEEGKKISEAIVAIPFTAASKNTKRYFKIPRQTIDWAEAEILGEDILKTFMDTKKPYKINKPAASIFELIKKMKKYVIPPRFDFLTNKALTPNAMVMFEFEANLTQQDLVNIWQNLPPTSLGRVMTGSQATISLDLLQRRENIDDPDWKGFSLLNYKAPDSKTSPFPNNIQWIVFKVKQKAKTNYFDITAKNEMTYAAFQALGKAITGDLSIKISEAQSKPGAGIPNYSFNWPYDFFSLVELAKIDSTLKLASHPTGEAKLSFDDFINTMTGPDALTPDPLITIEEKELTMEQSTAVGTDIPESEQPNGPNFGGGGFGGGGGAGGSSEGEF